MGPETSPDQVDRARQLNAFSIISGNRSGRSTRHRVLRTVCRFQTRSIGVQLTPDAMLAVLIAWHIPGDDDHRY